MANTFIRRAGAYLVESNGVSLLIDGRVAQLHPAAPDARTPDGDRVLFVADTGKLGANGKRDWVAISAACYAKHVAARAPEPAPIDDRARLAAEIAYDRQHNEGGEGFNPHRRGSERTYDRLPRRDRRYPEGA